MKYIIAIFILGMGLQANAARCNFEKNGLGDYKDFVKFAKKLRKIKTLDDLGRYANYPLKINLKPEKKLVENRAQLKSLGKAVLTDDVKKAVLNANVRLVYCDQQGIMLGKGNVWLQKFKGQYKIVAINP